MSLSDPDDHLLVSDVVEEPSHKHSYCNMCNEVECENFTNYSYFYCKI